MNWTGFFGFEEREIVEKLQWRTINWKLESPKCIR